MKDRSPGDPHGAQRVLGIQSEAKLPRAVWPARSGY